MVINDAESLSIGQDNRNSDAFGLWVKLKTRIDQRPEEDRDEGMDFNGDRKIEVENKNQMNENSNDMKKVCKICQKTFRSGKALGGHMRIHVQQANKKDLQKPMAHQTIDFKKQNPRDEKVFDFVKKKEICEMCGKEFPSKKSLFGHMRCHPGRNWKGVHPPSSMAKNSSSSSSSLSDAEPSNFDDQTGEKIRAVDLTQSLKRWPVTAKRGRKATAAAGSLSELSSSDEDQLRDAVNYLMMLSKGDSPESGLIQRQDFCESEAEIVDINNRISKLKRPLLIDQSQHGNEQKGSNEIGINSVIADYTNLVPGESVNKIEDEQEHNHISDNDDDRLDSKKDQDSESTNFKVVIMNKTIKKRKKMKLCDLKLSTTASSDKFRCNTCNKSFATHQALGGHRSSHYKLTINAKEDNNISMSFNNTSTSDHARDDHKTSNNGRLAEVRSSETSHMGRKVLDIDLNEAPPSEDEAGFGSELACSW